MYHLLFSVLPKLSAFCQFLNCIFLARIFSKEARSTSLVGVLLWQSRGLVSLQCELRLRASDPFTNDTSGSRRLEALETAEVKNQKKVCSFSDVHFFRAG